MPDRRHDLVEEFEAVVMSRVRQTMEARERVCETAYALTRPDMRGRLVQIVDSDMAPRDDDDPLAGWTIACDVPGYWTRLFAEFPGGFP